MTKQDIIKEVSKELGTTAQKTNALVVAVFELLETSLEDGIDVEISGFGKFIIRQKNRRIGRNPMTGEEAEITERKVVTFKPSKIFRNAVNNSREEL
jgi:integration host factor subunit alpha